MLQTVVEACHKKRQCKFHASPSAFGGDPCPGFRKYIEVAYKCRPCKYYAFLTVVIRVLFSLVEVKLRPRLIGALHLQSHRLVRISLAVYRLYFEYIQVKLEGEILGFNSLHS